MRSVHKVVAAFTVVGLVVGANCARAAFVVDVLEVGSDVVATGSGTLNTAALTVDTPPPFGLDESPAVCAASTSGVIGVGAPAQPDQCYGISGPDGFGPGGTIYADSSAGDFVELWAERNQIDVPSGYVSGSALSGSATWDNQTFSSLGVTPGTYVWTWGSGPTADSYTLNIGAVPEPASFSLLALGAGGLLVRRRRLPDQQR